MGKIEPKITENLQNRLEEELPRINSDILLHCCCAACSTSCLEYLNARNANLVLYYANPNIDSFDEYARRKDELVRFNEVMDYGYSVIAESYEPDTFFAAVKGLEDTGEGGERCKKCFELRFALAAKKAREKGIGYILSTLSVSPHKDAKLLYEIGSKVASKEGVEFLPSDFKKGGGFSRGVRLCKEYGIYRQNYCGCVFSKREAKKK